MNTFEDAPVIIFAVLVFIIVIGFWLWLLVDCSRRIFSNKYEKIAWVFAMFFIPLISSFAYLVVIKLNNPKGLL